MIIIGYNLYVILTKQDSDADVRRTEALEDDAKNVVEASKQYKQFAL